MKSFVVLCIVAVVCSAFGVPEKENHALLLRSRRDLQLIGNAGKHVQVLVENLGTAAREAMDAVDTFKASMRDEVDGVRDKIQENILKFKLRVTDAVDNVMQRVSNTSEAVRDCVNTHRASAAAVFDETMSGTMACVDERIDSVSGKIQDLTTMATQAMTDGSKALDDLKKCTINNTNLLSAGTCLGGVMFDTEVKSARFIAQCAVTMGRINLDIAMLPASLEVCAGKRLIHTGLETGKIIIGVGTCSTKGVYNSIVGKPNVE